ncbi:MAG: LysM peptidoglycan-binding domain-containing protein [Planctomycetes bacterium]|nr:LysM peptidoglycan-binding domain-containing protein [Planctomycetota bacterium]
MKYLVGCGIACMLCMGLVVGCNQDKDMAAAPDEQTEPPMFPEETVPKAEPIAAATPVDVTAAEPAPAPKPAPKESYAEPKAPKTYVIQKGDTLQKISDKFYGTTKKFDKIYQANTDVLKDKNSLKVGTKIKIPD